MLQPHSRRLLSESLKAPTGYKLDYAVGTTYSLDLFALLHAPVSFAFNDAHQANGHPLADPLALLKAVREYANRMLIFCQAGQIKLPKSFPPLVINLEETVVEVSPESQQGVFHPKVWFLRYVGPDESVVIRFLCLTRNLTYDKSWDTIVCLDGDLADRKNAIANNHPLGEFVEALPLLATRKLSRLWKGRIEEMAADVRRVNFEIPEPFESVHFHPLGIGRRVAWPFPDRCDKLLTISPFVSDSTLRDLCSVAKSAQLVSRQDQLEMLQPTTIESFTDGAWTLSQHAEPEPSEFEENDTSEKNLVEPTSLSGLHAKVYILDQGASTRIFAGSANATRAAFSENVEFLTELRGKKRLCGVDVVLGNADSDTDSPRSATLSAMLERFSPEATRQESDELKRTQEFEWRSAMIARQLADSTLSVICHTTDQPDSFRLEIAPARKLKLDLQGYTLKGKLLSLVKQEWKNVDINQSPWIHYDALTLLSVTGFVAFEVTDSAKGYKRQFVLNCPIINPPPDRDTRLIQSLLSDPEKVLRYLLMLLGNGQSPPDSGNGSPEPNSHSQTSKGTSVNRSPLFESLLRSLSENPPQIEQFANTVEAMSATEAGQQMLPADLDSIWLPIRDAWLEQNSGKGKRGTNK